MPPSSDGAGTGRHARRLALAALVLLVGAAALAGCTQETRYKTLTFFFTGVPAPGEEDARRSASAKRAASPAGVVAVAIKAARKLHQEGVFVHGPVAARACDSCHSLGSTASFSVPGKPAGDGTPSFGPRLAAPKRVICGTCHTAKMQGAGRAGLWQHGPAAAGGCLECHDPHRSRYRYMLREDPRVLCLGCHAEKSAAALARRGAWAHGPSVNGRCVLCHDPHAAGQPLMIKASSRAALCVGCHEPSDIRKNPVHPEDELPDCTLCHNPHGSSEAMLLRG